MIYIPFFLRSRLLDSIDIAERLKGSAPNTSEVYTVTAVHYRNTAAMGWCNAFLQNLYREDLFYADKQFTYWTTSLEGEDKEGFEKFSERFRRLYPGYQLDKNMRVRARPETAVLNHDELMSIFRSKDAKLWKKSAWMFENEFKFLDGAPNDWNKIAFASFPRSGNTFLRKYCELLTGVQTGADNTLHVNVMLQLQGMKGEDVVDDTVWIVKTHSPWIMPYQPVFTANKMMCVVRNPLDVVISWMNLVALCNHNQKVAFDPAEKYPVWFDWWVKDCITHMANWYKVVLHDARKREVPTIFIRYEDLCAQPEHELKNLMRYISGQFDITGTNGERRVAEVLAKGQAATQTYDLKESSKKFNNSMKFYT